MSIDLDIGCFLALPALALPFRPNPIDLLHVALRLKRLLLRLSHRLSKCIHIPDRQNCRASLRRHGIHHSHSPTKNTCKRHII